MGNRYEKIYNLNGAGSIRMIAIPFLLGLNPGLYECILCIQGLQDKATEQALITPTLIQNQYVVSNMSAV